MLTIKLSQAKMEGGEGQAGLIPGLILQEQRMASKNNTNNDKTSSIGCGGTNRRKKKNKKMNYSANKNSGMYFEWTCGLLNLQL